MRVALMRTGTVLYADNHKASPVAGNQDALGILRYLTDAGHDVAIYGQAQGFEDTGHTVFNIDTSGLNDHYAFHDFKLFRERFAPAIEGLGNWKPDLCLNIVGACPTVSIDDNPWQVTCQMWAKRTVAPCLVACEELKLPRVCVVNDPRNYAKDHEMHYMPWCRPCAILSQGVEVIPRMLRGKKQFVHVADASAENWWSYGMPLTNPFDRELKFETVVVAHTHMEDSRIARHRDTVWDQVISSYEGERLTLVGKGWEKTKHRDLHGGLVKHDEVQHILRHAMQGPMIPIASRFNTGKLREYVVAGCLPRPVISASYTYDAREKYVPLDSPLRVKAGEPWNVLNNPQWVRDLQQATTPDFSLLEKCMAEVVGADTLSESWLKEFGGVVWQTP